MTHPFFVRQVAVDIEPEVAGALVQLATRLRSLLFLLLLGRHNGTGTVKKKKCCGSRSKLDPYSATL